MRKRVMFLAVVFLSLATTYITGVGIVWHGSLTRQAEAKIEKVQDAKAESEAKEISKPVPQLPNQTGAAKDAAEVVVDPPEAQPKVLDVLSNATGEPWQGLEEIEQVSQNSNDTQEAPQPPTTATAHPASQTAPGDRKLSGDRAKKVWPACTNETDMCGGMLGGPATCKGPAYVDTEFYGRLVPENDHVQYVHGHSGAKFDYEIGEKMCKARAMSVCTQDQLGAAWYLGYENGCRGFVSDRWAVGMPDAALQEHHNRRGHRISVAPSGIVLSKANANALRVGMNGKFEEDEAVVGIYCCSLTDLNKGRTRPCDQQMAQAPPQLLTAFYIRWFEHLRKNNGYTVLLGGTLIGALRNHSLIPEVLPPLDVY